MKSRPRAKQAVLDRKLAQLAAGVTARLGPEVRECQMDEAREALSRLRNGGACESGADGDPVSGDWSPQASPPEVQ